MVGVANGFSNPAGERPCPQCGATSVIALPCYSTAEWHVVACAVCGFVFLQNPPAYERLEDEFAWEKTAPAETERRHAARPLFMWLDDVTRWRLSMFRRDRADLYRRLFRPGRVLDVGCGGYAAPPEPFIPYGIEISKVLYERSARLMEARGGKAIHGPAAEAIGSFPDGFFSGVILNSVVEHEAQPKRLLAGVARVLEPEGSAQIRVPNFGSINRMVNGGGWCGFRHPDHVNYFTLTSLKRMAEDCGLTLRLLHPIRLPVDDNINAVLTRVAA
jgi:SAM-dependent methyltransferase